MLAHWLPSFVHSDINKFMQRYTSTIIHIILSHVQASAAVHVLYYLPVCIQPSLISLALSLTQSTHATELLTHAFVSSSCATFRLRSTKPFVHRRIL
jgi:flagellar motor switch protein FliG